MAENQVHDPAPAEVLAAAEDEQRLEAIGTEAAVAYIKSGKADVPRKDDGMDGWRGLYRHYYGDEGALARPGDENGDED